MRVILAIAMLTLALTATAQTTYRWVDKEGKVHYTDRPPAANEATKVEEKRAVLLGTDQTPSYSLRQAMADYPVTLYTQASCGDVCKEARNHLTQRGVPFADKTLATEAEIAALRTLAGEGELVVPIMQVGRKTSRGYSKSAWDSLLDAAGYPKNPAKPSAANAKP